MYRISGFDRGANMGTLRKGFGLRIMAMVALAGALGACAQSQPEVNRVQPDYVKKADLSGEWYFQETVVQAPYTSAFTFPGYQGVLERGVFEVQENYVYFYRTYEYVQNSETIGQSSDVDTPLLDENGKPVTRDTVVNGVTVKAPVYVFRGSPVGKFPIAAHFDIKRQYNPTTGEEMNVVEENGGDREWWQRQYMRVNWVNNGGAILQPGASAEGGKLPYGPMSFGRFDNSISFLGGPYVYNGEGASDDEKPVFDYSNDDNPMLEYFDSVYTLAMSAPTEYLDGYGTVPSCWFYPWYAGQVFECSSELIKVRTAFKRVEPTTYVPTVYDDVQMQKFGYFKADRLTYDELRGITFAGQSNKASLHNIWEEWVVDANGKVDYAKMTPKPLVYYLSENFPRELVTPSIELVAEWNETFVEAVKARKGSAPAHDMYILCENNASEAKAAEAAGQPTANWDATDSGNVNAAFCKNMDFPKRRGDLRYNLMSSINEPISYGLYGYGPSSTDPITGETIQVAANSYVAAMKQGAERAIETIEMMAGVRDFREIEDGSYITDGMSGKRLALAGTRPSYSASDIQNIANTVVTPELRKSLATVGLPVDNNFAQSRLNRIKDHPEWEQLMLGDDVKALFRSPIASQGKDADGDLLDRIALRRWASNDGMKRQAQYQHDHAMQNIYLASFADTAILGLVREYGQIYNQEFCTEFDGQFPGIFDWSAFKGLGGKCEKPGAVDEKGYVCKTLSKELSADGSLSGNYWVNDCSVKKLLDQMRVKVEKIEGTNPNAAHKPASPLYWDTEHPELASAIHAFRNKLDTLREGIRVELWQKIYKGVQLHEVGHTLGLRHNFEASTDALNFDEEYWNLKLTRGDDGKLHPVNLWQRDTDDQSLKHIRQKQSSTVMDYTAKFNGRFEGLGHYDHAAIKYGYGGAVEVFNNPPNLDAMAPYGKEPNADIPWGPQNASADQEGNQSVVVPSGDPLEDAMKKIHYTNYVKFFGDDIGRMYDRKDVPADQVAKDKSLVEVPYRFCSDELTGRTPTCQVFDEGVDPFEIVRNAAETYENYWPFYGYSHDSVLWWPDNYANGVNSRFGEMRRQFQYWVLGMSHYNKDDWWAKNVGNGVPWDQDINGGLTATVAAYESFNTMSNAFGRPEEARYGQNEFTSSYEPLNNLDTTVYINQAWILQESGARPLYAAFDYGGYLYTPWRAGAIYDRIAAFVNLADPTITDYPWVEEQSDQQRYRVSFYTVFPKQVVRLMGGLMTSRQEAFGWWVCVNEQGKATHIARRDFFQDVAPAGCPIALNPEAKSTFPNARYRIPMLAAYYGMSLMVNNLDLSFLDTSRLCLKGSGECVDFAPGSEVIEFQDPLSGKIYQAARVGDANDYDAAYELVKDAKEAFQAYVNPKTGEFNLELLQNDYYFSNLQFLIGRLELVRGMHQLYSY